MYGKWLFKEIKTEYGLCKVEIFRKNFTDTAIEIGALESNSLTLAMENLGNITDPIGKSVCSFSIIDTDQIDYDEFFTPDATAYMVVVSTKTGEGAYVTRWSGYVTPDFFAENLSYRTPISISARDNIGYLNDVDFDLDASTITVRGLIEAAFNRIAEDYPMQIVFATQKQTAEGVLAIDATISTMLLREGSWYEAIETVLHDLGLQMRWVDNNTIAVLDLSQIPEYYATQAFNFVDASGYREILPAWRELAQEQDYGLRENFFEGQINNANLRFVKEETLNLPLSMGGVTGNPVMKYYAPSNWGVAGSTLTINTDNYKYIGSYGQEPSGQGGRIYFTGVQKDAANLPQNYMSYRQPVYVSQRGKMSIAFNAFNSLLATNKTSAETLQVYNPADRFMDFATGDSLQLGLKINVFLHVGTKTFILGDTWEEITGAETNSLYFTLDKVGQLGANGTTTPTEQEITIDVNTIPYNGELELRIYGFCIHEKTNLQEDAGLATYDWLKMVSYIDDVRYSYERELATGQGARTEIAPLHNVKESKSYKFGQVPVYAGGINAYAGGLYNASKNMESMVLFQRNANATNYSLLELVGREVIHFNKKNYNKLSGTIRSLAKEPLMFNRLFVRNGKRYAPFAYSLNIISNQMEITTMQEVENYVTESFSEINSAVTTGGAIVSAGNNTVMQYSQDAGNTKRIYELTAATEEEKKDTWVMIDGTAFPEARKINVKDLEGLNEEQVKAYLTAKKYATQSWVKGITNDLETDIANRVLIEDFEKLEDAVDSIAGYFTNGSANNALKLGGQLPSYYATKSALDTTNGNVVSLTQRMGTAESGISTNKTNIATLTTGLSNLTSRVSTAEGTIKEHTDAITLNANNIASNAKSITTNATAITAVSNRVQTFEDVIGIDSNGDVYIKGMRNFYTEGGTIGMAGLGSGGSGGGGAAGLGSVTVRVNGQDYITDASGIVTLPNYPSLAGYATEQWVGANYLGLGGGTISSSHYQPLIINSTYSAVGDVRIAFSYNGDIKGLINWDSTTAFRLYNYISASYIGVKDDGTPTYNGYTLIHTGNYADTTDKRYLRLSGGTLTGGLTISSGNFIVSTTAGDTVVNQLYPTVDNTYVLGLGTRRWSDLYTVLINGYTPIHSGNIGSQVVEGINTHTSSSINAGGDIAKLNSYYKAGIFKISRFSGLDGLGTANSDGLIVNWPLDHTYGQQWYIDDESHIIQTRYMYNGSWSSFRTIAFTDSNVASADYATSAGDAKNLKSTSSTYDYIVGIGRTSTFYDWSQSVNGGYYYGLQMESPDANYKLQIAHQLWGYGLIWRNCNGSTTYGDWKAIVDTDNISLFNAGSATKLQTARTIWGQSFDGTGNVSGIAYFPNGDLIYAKDEGGTYRYVMGLTSGLSLGYGSASAGIDTYILGKNIHFRYYDTDYKYAMSIKNNGNVLIGTTDDNGGKLQIATSTGVGIEITSSATYGGIGISQANGYRWFVGVDNTKELYFSYNGSHRFDLNDTGNLKLGGSLAIKAGDYIANRATLILNSNSENAADIIFKANSTTKGNYGWWAISSRNDSTGRFAIFRGSENGANASEAEIFTIRANGQTDVNGNLTVTGDITSEGTMAMAKLASSSDRKLKENIKWLSADRAMGVVRALRPTEWDWKKDHTHSFGFIAQDVQPIIPEMVSSVNDTLRLEYNQLHAFEIGAIQHIDSEVEILKRRVNELENELKQYRRNA